MRTEPYFISPIVKNGEHWIARSADKKVIVSQFDEHSQTICPLYGYDPKQIRDWNEEYQVISASPSETYFQRMQKERAQ